MSSSSSFEKESNTSDDDNGKRNSYAVDKTDKPDILNPGPHDVLLGRGGGTNNHIGNKNFRDLVTRHKMRYLACSKVDKPKVAREVVSIWRRLDPPGRFLQRKDETKKGPGSVRDEDVVWTEVDDSEARRKASQCLRERTPDVQPYIAHLRQHEDQQTAGRGSTTATQSASANNQRSPGTTTSGSRTNEQTASSLFGINDRPMSVNHNAVLRRGSMPVTGQSASNGFVPTIATTGVGIIRTQDRRVSLPPNNQLHTHQVRDIGMGLMDRHQQVLRDAYTAIEQPNELNFLGGQMQQQLLPSRQAIVQQQMMDPRLTMMQTANNQSIPELRGPGMGMSPQISNTGVAFGQTIHGQAQFLMQQQQLLVQQHQQLLEEQERLVRQEHMIARREAEIAKREQLARELQGQQVKPSTPFSGQSVPDSAYSQISFLSDNAHDLEPVPLLEEVEYCIPLSVDPDTQTSSSNLVPDNDRQKVGTMSPNKNTGKMTSNHVETTDCSETSGLTMDPTKCLPDETKTSPKVILSEYRKTLDSYITNNQASIPFLDSKEDNVNEEDQTFDGIASSDWIEQQLMNDSGDLSHSTKDRPRLARRSSSKKSLMSLASSAEEMSFAFSEMDQFEELSKGTTTKRTATRSMSILSTNTNMSELTDFDDIDCM